MRKGFLQNIKTQICFFTFGVFFLLGIGIESIGQTLTIGDDSYYDEYSPIYSCYSYNYSQQIYTVEEMMDAGAPGAVLITKIAFKTGPYTAYLPYFDDWTIYMGNSNQYNFGSNTNWVPSGVFTEVYEGTISSISSDTYVEFTLSTPFFWDGYSNVIVAVYENAPNYDCTQPWITYYPSEDRMLLFYSDDVNPDPNAPPSSNMGPYSGIAHVQFEYETADVCDDAGDVVAGMIASEDVCPGAPFTIINSGTTLASGIEREWQIRVPSGTGTWITVDASLGINYYLEFGIEEASDFRCIATCTSTGSVDTTNELTVNLKPITECYCVPDLTYDCTWESTINDVYTSGASADISNMSTGCTGAYTSYADEYIVYAVQGIEVTLNVGIINSDGGVKAWVDWNQDGIFSDDEIVVESSGFVWAWSEFTGTFEVPLDAVPGSTVMRVATRSWSTSFDACMSDMWDGGEVEDYGFTVIEAIPCEELDLVAGTLSALEICPSASFTVMNSGTSLGLGFDRVWQERVPSGTGDWATISGAALVNYNNTAGITEPTDYRCIVSCPATGEVDTTNIITVTLSPFTECYCEPDISYDCTWESAIDDVYTTDASADVTNMNTGCTGSYTDYSDDFGVYAVQGTGVTLNVGVINSDGGVKAWVDWNHDGVFSDEEIVAESSGYVGAGSMFTSTFDVPLDALPGTTRMRVITRSWSTYFDACMTEMWDGGEAEDYAFTVIEAIPCEDLELIAGILSPIEICPSTPFSVVNSGTTLGLGFERVWQERVPSGTGDWVTITGASSVNYYVADGITEETDYRCIVSCPATGEVDTTNAITVSLSPFFDCYCEPDISYDCVWEAAIDGVYTEGATIDISNTGTGCTGNYTDYSGEYVVTAMQFSEVTANVDIINADGGVKIWIDWNQDGIFESEELVGASAGYIYYSTFTTTFTVPLTAVPGLTKMRVATRSWSTSFDACMTDMWDGGEVEDYGFIVVPAPSCSESGTEWPEEVNSVSTPGAVCGTGTVFLNIDAAMPLASGITYQWESSPTGTGDWTVISTDHIFPNLMVEDISANTYFRCNIKCEGETYYYSTALLVESVSPEAPTVFEGEHCGPGSVELTGEIGEGIIFWYEEPFGGMPFASGDIVMSPEITTTTTFYADGGAYPAALIEIGDGTSASSMWSDGGPFKLSYNRTTNQFLYTAAQIADAGGVAGVIEDLRFYLAGMPSEGIPDYTISMKLVSSSMTSLSWQTSGLTEVYYTPLFSPAETGWQVFPLTTAFDYDGTSGIVVQVCWSSVSSSWSYTGTHRYTNTPGQMLYYGSTSEGSSCGDIGTWTSNELPNVIFGFAGCVSDRVPVIAHIREVPMIEIDVEEGEYCLFNNEFIIPTAPEQPAGTTFLWNTGGTTPSIAVSGSGIETDFWVEVTNEWGCTNSDTATLTLKVSPEVDLGPDVAVCEGGVVTLDAGTDGSTYYWNTSETTQLIHVNDGGDYAVIVTNEFGCMGTDTIHVTVEGFAPTIDGIIIDNISSNTFAFTPLHPENILTYKWSFGDGSVSLAESPTHMYEEPGTYDVVLEVTSDCGVDTYYTYVSILTGIENTELSRSLKVYPNPAQQYLNIETLNGIKMEQLIVTNHLGQEVLVRKLDKIENFRLDISQLTSGMYHLKIMSGDGEMVKKFQVIR